MPAATMAVVPSSSSTLIQSPNGSIAEYPMPPISANTNLQPTNFPGVDYSQSPVASLISKVTQDTPPTPEVLLYVWKNLHAAAIQSPMARPSKAELQTLRKGTLRTLAVQEHTNLRTVMRLWGEVEAIVEQFPADKLAVDERQILVDALMESFRFEIELCNRPFQPGISYIVEPRQAREEDVAVCLESLQMLINNTTVEKHRVRLTQEQRITLITMVAHYYRRNGMVLNEPVSRMESALRGLLRKQGDCINTDSMIMRPPDSTNLSECVEETSNASQRQTFREDSAKGNKYTTTPSSPVMVTRDTSTTSRRSAIMSSNPIRSGKEACTTSEQTTIEGILEPAKPRVLFTGLQKNDIELWSKVLVSLGVQIVDNWRDCNILVTDRSRRTTKYLACLAANKFLVNVAWADECRKNHRLVDVEPYLLVATQLSRIRNFPAGILTGREFFITSNVHIPRQDLIEIIEAGNGRILSELQIDGAEDLYQPIIIGSLRDTEAIENISERGWTVHSVEILLSGILNGEINHSNYQVMAPGRIPPDPDHDGHTPIAMNGHMTSPDRSSESNESSNPRSRALLRGTSIERGKSFRARSKSRD